MRCETRTSLPFDVMQDMLRLPRCYQRESMKTTYLRRLIPNPFHCLNCLEGLLSQGKNLVVVVKTGTTTVRLYHLLLAAP